MFEGYYLETNFFCLYKSFQKPKFDHHFILSRIVKLLSNISKFRLSVKVIWSTSLEAFAKAALLLKGY